MVSRLGMFWYTRRPLLLAALALSLLVDDNVILEVLELTTLTRLLLGVLAGKGERAKNANVEELNVVERSASRRSHDGVARDIEN